MVVLGEFRDDLNVLFTFRDISYPKPCSHSNSGESKEWLKMNRTNYVRGKESQTAEHCFVVA